MYALFDLEDTYGLHIDQIYGELCIKLDRQNIMLISYRITIQ